MRTSASNRRLRMLLTSLNSGTLIPRPEFQRRLVWNNSDKLSFIQTVLDGFPFPEIYIAAGDLDSETGLGTEQLVDGQQRLTTLNQYFRGSSELKYGVSRYGKEIIPYAMLEEKEKEEFLEYEVVIRDLGRLEISTVIEIFKRINSANYALNPMEIHNARYAGEFKQFAERLVANKIFAEHKTFTVNDVRRMGDVRYGLVLVSTVLSTYFNLDTGIEEYLEKYNDSFEKSNELRAQFNTVFERIYKMEFAPNERVWRKADLFTLIVEVYRALFKRGVDVSSGETGLRLKEFYHQVDAEQGDSRSAQVKSYYLSALQGTNLRANRLRRGEIVQHIIDPAYDLDSKVVALD